MGEKWRRARAGGSPGRRASGRPGRGTSRLGRGAGRAVTSWAKRVRLGPLGQTGSYRFGLARMATCRAWAATPARRPARHSTNSSRARMDRVDMGSYRVGSGRPFG